MTVSRHLSEPTEMLPEGRSRLNRVPKQGVAMLKEIVSIFLAMPMND